MKAAPEQIRRATENETILEELSGPVELPWTFSHIEQDERRRVFTDITGEAPSDEMEAAEEHVRREPMILEEPTPNKEWVTTTRATTKRPGDVDLRQIVTKQARQEVPRGEKRPADENPGGRSSSSRPRRDHDAFCNIVEHCWAVEAELPLPESRRGWKKFMNNPEAYMAGQLRKKQIEVHERRLTPEEAIRFCEAKDEEVKNFIAAQCFQQAQEQFPDEKEIIGMRWLLTWKHDPSQEDGKKAKARQSFWDFKIHPTVSVKHQHQHHPRLGDNCFYNCAHGRSSAFQREMSVGHFFREKLSMILCGVDHFQRCAES